MPIGHHRKPFSSKQKKEQLKAKRERKRNAVDDSSSDDLDEGANAKSTTTATNEQALGGHKHKLAAKFLHQQPVKNQAAENLSHDPNRFNLIFLKETQENLRRLRKEATKSLKPMNDADLEVDIDDVYKPSSPLDMPIRPQWNYEMTKEQLDQQERTYFNNYLNQIFDNYKDNELSYFELNLETWRQLWRVVEISDIILLIVDIRFPALHFSPKFYEYCTDHLHKDVILILNKIDLVPTSLVIAWKSYFERKYPNLHIILFSSSKQIKFRQKRSKKETSEADSQQDELEIKSLAAEIHTARAHRQLYECVKNIVKNNIDLSNWDALTDRLVKNANLVDTTNEQMENLTLTNEDTELMNDLFHSKVERKKFEHGFVTIGCCGFPNVGKSSLLNSLNGRKVVSVSRTPGHTKHLQTIFLTKSVRLCDCPGLVFPSLVIKPLQILAGIYPIAQLQEPYSAIRYLAERIPVVDILKLKHPADTKPNEDNEWSPIDICEAWALKRGYLTAKASRPDAYRAANELLRMALDGRLCLSLRPRNYSKEIDKWSQHDETKKLNEVIANVESTAKQNKLNHNYGARAATRTQTDPEHPDEDEDSFDDIDYSDNGPSGQYGADSDVYKDFNYKHGDTSSDQNDKKDDDSDTDRNDDTVLKTSSNLYNVLSSTKN